MKLHPPDTHHLQAAQGWLGLGDHVSAFEELELVSPLLRTHPVVLEVRCQIYGAAKKWDAVVIVASALVKIAPKNSRGWIDRSFALHVLRRTREAFDLLLPAAAHFPEVPIIPYNLACYCAQLGRLEDAQRWLQCAYEIGDKKEIQLMVLDDPDLEPLRA